MRLHRQAWTGPVAGTALGLAALAVFTFSPSLGAGSGGVPGTAGPGAGPGSAGPARPAGSDLAGARLIAYSSCTQLLADVKAEALEEVGPYGLPGDGPGYPWPGLLRTGVALPAALNGAVLGPAAPAGAAQAAPAGASAPGGATTYSTTNDQEAGVDEPDLVKTDGRLMVVLRQQPVGVQVVSVEGPAPQLEGFIGLPQLGQTDGLLLSGQYAVVIGTATLTAGTPVGLLPSASTQVVVVSLADPAHPVVARQFSVQGYEEAARLVDGRVVVVVEGQPRLAWAQPQGPGARAERAALQANRRAIMASRLSQWLPSVTVAQGGTRLARASGCASTYHTAVGAGLGTVSVVSFDPASDVPGREVTVLASAQDVYASTTQLYVATTAWPGQPWPCPPGAMCPWPCPPGAMCMARPQGGVAMPQGGEASTDIYGFDTSDPTNPTYLGSGSVPGTLIGQYAMSEYGGYLRVATTVGQPAAAPVDGGPARLPAGHVASSPGPGAPSGGTAPRSGHGQPTATYPGNPASSDNIVTVLEPHDGSLVTVSTLSGLGEGEKIYAVRFAGPLAYVVTFRQTDPLYVIDLSQPAHPVLAGQLPLEGYSSSLQLLRPGLLLGIGQSVDADLRTVGLQLEAFDVAQPGQPSLVSRQELGPGATSAAEHDPHALLWWPAADLVALPVDGYGAQGGQPTSAVELWTVGPSGVLSEAGSISQPAGSQPVPPEVEREVVVGQDLYTVSEQGVMASDLADLAPVAWLPYGAEGAGAA